MRKKEPLTGVFIRTATRNCFLKIYSIYLANVYLSITERRKNVVRISVINFTAAIARWSLFPFFHVLTVTICNLLLNRGTLKNGKSPNLEEHFSTWVCDRKWWKHNVRYNFIRPFNPFLLLSTNKPEVQGRFPECIVTKEFSFSTFERVWPLFWKRRFHEP